jgi:hypothetical protein
MFRWMMAGIATTSLVSQALAQGPVAQSAREAALAWVIERGVLPIPAANVAIVREPDFKLRPPDTRGSVPRPTRASDVVNREAVVLASRIGKGAFAADGEEVLVCVRYDCATRSSASVVRVRDQDPGKDGDEVLVTLFLPGANKSERVLYSAVIQVERRESGWAGVKTVTASERPTRVRVPVDSLLLR